MKNQIFSSIKTITFTGLDDKATLFGLNLIQMNNNAVEWGILYSPSNSGKNNRYPSTEKIDSLLAGIFGRFAIHLCGGAIKEFYEGKDCYTKNLISKASGNKKARVQLNMLYDKMTVTARDKVILAMANNDIEYIVQANDNNVKLLSDLEAAGNIKYSVLFDRSGGNGIVPSSWPTPIQNVRCGYAGGLNPDNIKSEAFNIVEVSKPVDIWIDMESGVRDSDDYLDLDKCTKVIHELDTL